MRVAVIFKVESDHYREVADYLRDFTRQTGYEIEEVNPDSRDGAAFCRTYDIVEYPTIVALDHSGRVQNTWRGRPLPQISQVGYYAQQN